MIDDILIALISGSIIGALVNYLGDVLPETRRLTHPTCKRCNQSVRWIDYILFKPCKTCQHNRSLRSILVVILLDVVAILLTIYPPAIGFWWSLLAVAYFALVIVIDLEHRLVMHPVSLFGILIGFALGIWRHGIWMTLLGGIAGFGIMLALYYLGIAFIRLVSKRKALEGVEEAIGFGDVILSGVMGIFLGWPGVSAGLVIAILLGGIVSLLILIYQVTRKKYKAYTAIPYAPFISLATLTLILLARPG